MNFSFRFTSFSVFTLTKERVRERKKKRYIWKDSPLRVTFDARLTFGENAEGLTNFNERTFSCLREQTIYL